MSCRGVGTKAVVVINYTLRIEHMGVKDGLATDRAAEQPQKEPPPSAHFLRHFQGLVSS